MRSIHKQIEEEFEFIRQKNNAMEKIIAVIIEKNGGNLTITDSDIIEIYNKNIRIERSEKYREYIITTY